MNKNKLVTYFSQEQKNWKDAIGKWRKWNNYGKTWPDVAMLWWSKGPAVEEPTRCPAALDPDDVSMWLDYILASFAYRSEMLNKLKQAPYRL